MSSQRLIVTAFGLLCVLGTVACGSNSDADSTTTTQGLSVGSTSSTAAPTSPRSPYCQAIVDADAKYKATYNDVVDQTQVDRSAANLKAFVASLSAVEASSPANRKAFWNTFIATYQATANNTAANPDDAATVFADFNSVATEVQSQCGTSILSWGGDGP